jgi:DNA-binding transcriptional MerR regulator
MKLLTSKQAAEKIGVTTRTLERWRKTNQFVPEVQTFG